MITAVPEFTHLTEEGQAVTRVKITLANLRSIFVVADRSGSPGLGAGIEVKDDLISLTMKNLVRDHRYLISKSTDLQLWEGLQDFIATGVSDPLAASPDIVTMTMQEPKQAPAAFYRVSSVD